MHYSCGNLSANHCDGRVNERKHGRVGKMKPTENVIYWRDPEIKGFDIIINSESNADMKDGSTAPALTRSGGRMTIDTGKVFPVAALFTAAMLWGGSFSAMRLAVQAMSPWSVMWLRMAIALVVILPFAGRLKLGAYRQGDWKLLVPMVIFQPCLYFLLESNALCLTTSSQAGVISASVPMMVAVGAWIILSEPLGKTNLAGLVLSVAGVAVLSLSGSSHDTASNPLLGNMLELCAMACAAVNIIMVKRLSARYNPWMLTAFQVFAGTLFFSPGLVLLIREPGVAWTLPLIFCIVFLGALVTLGAFGLYNWGMSHIAASRASVFINLVPVTAVAIGWMVMGESLSGLQCVAAASVIIGVGISQRRVR
jgi:drug/metabolite transporter (DMT)-like permease